MTGGDPVTAMFDPLSKQPLKQLLETRIEVGMTAVTLSFMVQFQAETKQLKW